MVCSHPPFSRNRLNRNCPPQEAQDAHVFRSAGLAGKAQGGRKKRCSHRWHRCDACAPRISRPGTINCNDWAQSEKHHGPSGVGLPQRAANHDRTGRNGRLRPRIVPASATRSSLGSIRPRDSARAYHRYGRSQGVVAHSRGGRARSGLLIRPCGSAATVGSGWQGQSDHTDADGNLGAGWPSHRLLGQTPTVRRIREPCFANTAG